MRKPGRAATSAAPEAASPHYVAARLYLMIEAVARGRIAPGQHELGWAAAALDDLDVSEETMDEAVRDHEDLVGEGVVE